MLSDRWPSKRLMTGSGHIFIDEAHANGVPELMRREVVEVLMAISDLALQCPFVELPAKSGLEVGFGR